MTRKVKYANARMPLNLKVTVNNVFLRKMLCIITGDQIEPGIKLKIRML